MEDMKERIRGINMYEFKDYYQNTVQLSFEHQPFQTARSTYGSYADMEISGF